MYYRLESGDTGFTEFTELLAKIVKTGAISDEVELELNVAGGNTTSATDNNDLKFKAYITSATISVSTGELTVVPINFTVNGDFTRVIN